MTAQEREERRQAREEEREAIKARQKEYDEAIKAKSEDEIIAINYFFNRQKKKGCLSKKQIPLVTDEQFDELVSKKRDEITGETVLAAMGIADAPQWITDPVKIFTYEPIAEYTHVSEDKTVRTSRVTITFMLFAEKQMYLYQKTFSLTDRYIDETAASLLYKDITSVSLHTLTTEVRHDLITPKGCFHKAKETQVWVPDTQMVARITVPESVYEVPVGDNKAIVIPAIKNLREEIVRQKYGADNEISDNRFKKSK